MAKMIDYPRASLSNAILLAEAVDSLGGSTKVGMAAEKMGRKVSGAFSAVVSAAVKYSLVSSKGGRVSTTSVFRSIKLAYTEEERRGFLRLALLSPPIFQSIAERFENKQLPVDHFDRLLIREFGVGDEIAARVAKYFLEGANQAGMLSPDNVLASSDLDQSSEESDESSVKDRSPMIGAREETSSHVVASSQAGSDPSRYSVTFRGPGLNSTIELRDEDDVLIVEATLNKVKRALAMPAQP